MPLKGTTWKFGHNIDTDVIIPARYLNTTDPGILGSHVMEGIEENFARRIQKGDILVAGKNFGCGSSREHAPLALKAAGIPLVVAASFARIFYRNALNMGLYILECEEAFEGFASGDRAEVDLNTGTLLNLTRGLAFQAKPLPPFMQELVRDGGLLAHIQKKKKL
jgi:3-isopropylmalate dehydratase small subunit